MTENMLPGITRVEEKALAGSPFRGIYRPEEKIPAIVVDNFPALGNLAALRFLEWVQRNPGGVISAIRSASSSIGGVR